MSAPDRARLLEVLAEMRTDLEADIAWLEGKPFDGRVVAEAFGRLGGTVSALAAVVAELAKEGQPL